MLPVVIYPTFVLVYSILVPPLHLKLPASILQSLFLHYLLNLGPEGGELLKLLNLEAIELRTHRDAAQHAHCVDLLGIQRHERTFLLTQIDATDLVLKEELLVPREEVPGVGYTATSLHLMEGELPQHRWARRLLNQLE
jgi:hypothetical protein